MTALMYRFWARWSIFGAVLSASAGICGTTDFYVATNGNDTNAGTLMQPFKTLEIARDAIRKAKATGPLTNGATVWIRGGKYYRDTTFQLDGWRDSGSPQSPIIYRNYTNEQVRLIGGRQLSGFRPVRDTSVFQRWPQLARGHVVEVDLPSLGITNYGQLSARSAIRTVTPAALELFFNGKPMTLARWPNEGSWEKIAGVTGVPPGTTGNMTNGFFYSGDHPRSWATPNEVWMHGYWARDWMDSYERVQTIDLDQRIIKTAPPYAAYGFVQGQRFYYFNILEELDSPSEYFVDRSSGRLYFWPPAPPDQGEALVSMLESPLIYFNGTTNVTIQGLTLEVTRNQAVRFSSGASNRVAGCTVRLVGNTGIQIDTGSGHAIVSCDIADTGDAGVWINTAGDRNTLTAAGHVVDNCHFQRQGRWVKCYMPAVRLSSGVGNRVSHNLIHDLPHCAIQFSGNEHVIEYNEIHHVALETGDVGAIYAGKDYSFRGNAIRYNFIHHMGGLGLGSMGVYMDDCVSGTHIYGNVFYQAPRAVMLGGGRDHQVENNIFVECTPALWFDGRGLDPSPVWHDMVYVDMKNSLYAMPHDLYRQRYPAILSLDTYYQSGSNGIPPENNVVQYNVCVSGTWINCGRYATANMLNLTNNYVGPDPGFVDRSNLNFRIGPDSPVWQYGFQSIPFEQIGIQPDRYRPVRPHKPQVAPKK
jgi:hypothetical protein